MQMGLSSNQAHIHHHGQSQTLTQCFKNRTGPTGDLSNSVQPNEPFYDQTGIEPVKPPVEPPNRSNHPIFYEPAKPFFSYSTNFCYY